MDLFKVMKSFLATSNQLHGSGSYCSCDGCAKALADQISTIAQPEFDKHLALFEAKMTVENSAFLEGLTKKLSEEDVLLRKQITKLQAENTSLKERLQVFLDAVSAAAEVPISEELVVIE